MKSLFNPKKSSLTPHLRSSATRTVFSAFSGLMMCSVAHAATVDIDFDSLAGMTNSPGSSAPVANQLSTGFLSLGVSFSSPAGYVAVVVHAPNLTVSMPNVIGGVTADGKLSYGSPVTISFFDPSNPAILGVTDFVSIRGDQVPLPVADASMQAFDVLGNSLGAVSASDSTAGLALSFTASGIHSITLTQNSASGSFDGTIGFDNLSFNTVQAVPVPAAVWLFASGLLGLIGVARRKAHTAGQRIDA
ncbi:MAG: VPLPA-CTERM sorting domain-containing protein [Sulfuricaulis sp.]|nr:VPLPA-CTERM sorting domain-containing protein [Sulfuricaulis sp.]